MMSKFAKLFDVEDTKVLYHATKDEDEIPCLQITTSLDNVVVSANIKFADTDEGYDKRDAALENLANQENAEKFYADCQDQFNTLGSE